MLAYVRNSLFDSPAQTLVNTVNIEGVMGKGVAKEFRNRFPEMFWAYKSLCDKRELRVGKLHLWRGRERWILNFPTKTTWRRPSKLEYIEQGLDTFCRSYNQMGISSVAFPPLGCGNGNLDWADVKPLMERYLRRLEIPVYIHDKQVPKRYVPEHLESAPSNYKEFISDIQSVVRLSDGKLETLKTRTEFSVSSADQGKLAVIVGSRRIYIEPEHLEGAWSSLQTGFLTYDQFSGSEDRKAKTYLFPILVKLPYVGCTELKKADWPSPTFAHALYFNREDAGGTLQAPSGSASHQRCLFRENGP